MGPEGGCPGAYDVHLASETLVGWQEVGVQGSNVVADAIIDLDASAA